MVSPNIITNTITKQSGTVLACLGKKGQFVLALAVGVVLALISWEAGVLDGSTDIFGGVSGTAASAGGPSAIIAFGAAFVIGATMIVLPCGFPAVFAMPSILAAKKGLRQRTTLSLIFLAASALPLAALGVGLSFGGDAVLGLLDTMKAKMIFSVVLYSSLGILAIAYALSQLGVIHLPSLTAKMKNPDMPGQDKPYRRSLVLGSTMGAGLGMGCPMPTYYILLGWVAAAATPLYGALLLGLYGLGRVLPAVGIGALITAGMDRRKVSKNMTAFREKTDGLTNGFLTAMGSYLLVLFVGLLLARVVAL